MFIGIWEERRKDLSHIHKKPLLEEEKSMKLKDVNECLSQVKKDVGDALICTTISNIKNGVTIGKIDCDDKLGACASQVVTFLREVIDSAENVSLGRYLFAVLNKTCAALFVIIGDYVWTIAFNPEKMPMGMIMNVYLDDYVQMFEYAAA